MNADSRADKVGAPVPPVNAADAHAETVRSVLRKAPIGRAMVALAALDALVAERDALQKFAEFIAMLPATTGGSPTVITKVIAGRARAVLAAGASDEATG